MSQSQSKETEYVYKTSSGKRYHKTRECRSIEPENAMRRDRDAITSGWEPCSKCHEMESEEEDEPDEIPDNSEYANNPLQVMLDAGLDPIEQGVDLDQFHEVPEELRERVEE